MNDYYSVEHWDVLKKIGETDIKSVEKTCIGISFAFCSPYYTKKDTKLNIDTYYFHYSVLEEYYTNGPAF